jgi:hypothetical protein
MQTPFLITLLWLNPTIGCAFFRLMHNDKHNLGEYFLMKSTEMNGWSSMDAIPWYKFINMYTSVFKEVSSIMLRHSIKQVRFCQINYTSDTLSYNLLLLLFLFLLFQLTNTYTLIILIIKSFDFNMGIQK